MVKYYYRLKQVDIDGKFNYSEIRTAVLLEDNNKGIRIAPNPVVRTMQIYFSTAVESGEITIKVLDA
ncbi:MAG: hypothetical protein WKF97_02800 [Chitinophagaceae bacterium]